MNNFFKKLLVSSFFLVFAVDASSMDVPPPPGGERSQPRFTQENKEDFRKFSVKRINDSAPLRKISEDFALNCCLNYEKDLEMAFLTLLHLISPDYAYRNIFEDHQKSDDYTAFLANPLNKATDLMMEYKEFMKNPYYKKGLEDDIDFYLTTPKGHFVIALFLGLGIQSEEDLQQRSKLIELLKSPDSNYDKSNYDKVNAIIHNLDTITPNLVQRFKETLTNLSSVKFSIIPADKVYDSDYNSAVITNYDSDIFFGDKAVNICDDGYSRLAYKITDQLYHYLKEHKQGMGLGRYTKLISSINKLKSDIEAIKLLHVFGQFIASLLDQE